MARFVHSARVRVELAGLVAFSLALNSLARVSGPIGWAEPFLRVGLDHHIAHLRGS